VIDPEVAAAEREAVFPECGTNIATRFQHRWDDDVLAGAEVTVRGRFPNQRVAPVPMEMNAIAVLPEPDGAYTVWVSSQVPFDVRGDLVDVLGVDWSRIR
jgi:CO/xanthine dehydrogenase Mo-binding subunit